MNIQLDIDEYPKKTDIQQIQKGIDKFNASALRQTSKEFAIYLRDENNDIRGGLLALFYTDEMHVILLYLDASLRQKGFGTKLMKSAEDEAIKRHCKYSYVDTFGFQAKDFYLNRGYHCIGKIDEALLGHSRIFFKKNLSIKD